MTLSNGSQSEQLTTALTTLSQAELALERAETVYQMLDVADAAQTYALFYSLKGLKDISDKATMVLMKANRKAGQWLIENVDHGSPALTANWQGLPDGITRKQAYNLRLQAMLPEDKFLAWTDELVSNGRELSVGGLKSYAANYAKAPQEYTPEREYLRTCARARSVAFELMKFADYGLLKPEQKKVIIAMLEVFTEEK